MLGKIIQRFKTQTIDTEQINTALDHYIKGRKWSEKGHYSEALEEFKQSALINPTQALTYFHLGFVYFNLNCFSDSKKAYQKFLDLSAELDFDSSVDDEELNLKSIKAIVYNDLGVIYESEGNFTKAIGSFMSTLRINRSNCAALNNLGGTYFKMGIYKEAIKAHEQVLNINPNDARAHYCMGLIHIDLKDTQRVIIESEILENLDKSLATDLTDKLHKLSPYYRR